MWSYIMEQFPTNQHTPGDISIAQEIATFHSAVLLSFHILINDSQKPSVHVEGKKKQTPQICLCLGTGYHPKYIIAQADC